MIDITRRLFLISTGASFLEACVGGTSDIKSRITVKEQEQSKIKKSESRVKVSHPKEFTPKSKKLIESGIIYLTIDDGPRRSMRKILDTLGSEHQATFFCVGNQLTNPYGFEMAYTALQQGHIIGNLSYSHPSFSRISEEKINQEIVKTHEIIDRLYQKANLNNPKIFRYPYGDSGGKNKLATLQILNELDYTSFGWDIDTEDWKYGSGLIGKDKFVSNLSMAKPRDIVLFHDTSLAIPIINYYKSRGFSSRALSPKTYAMK